MRQPRAAFHAAARFALFLVVALGLGTSTGAQSTKPGPDSGKQLAARVQSWNETKSSMIGDWVLADRTRLYPRIDAKSAAYAKEKGVTARDLGKES